MGTHLNCIDKSMQFKCVPTTYVFIKKQTKNTLAAVWSQKTMELLDYALIGVCAVIRSNTVYQNDKWVCGRLCALPYAYELSFPLMGVKPGTLWLKLGELTRWKALCCEAPYGYELNLPLMGLKPRTLWFEVGSANQWAIRMLPSTLFKVILRWWKALCKGMLYNHKVNLPLIRFKLPTSWFKVRTTERSAMQILQKKWQSHSTGKYSQVIKLIFQCLKFKLGRKDIKH